MKKLRFVFAVVFALLFTVNAQAKVEVKKCEHWRQKC